MLIALITKDSSNSYEYIEGSLENLLGVISSLSAFCNPQAFSKLLKIPKIFEKIIIETKAIDKNKFQFYSFDSFFVSYIIRFLFTFIK